MLRSSRPPELATLREEPNALAAAAALAAAVEGLSSAPPPPPVGGRPPATTGDRARCRPPRRLVVGADRAGLVPFTEGGRACASRCRLCGRSMSVLSVRKAVTMIVQL